MSHDLPDLQQARKDHVFRLRPGRRRLIYRGRSRHGEVLVSIAGELYGYRAPDGEDLDGIERRFLRSLDYGPGRALAWLKKQAVCTLRPLRQASLFDFV